MMVEEAPETCWATHKHQVINLWNCYILLVNLFESYDDARTYEHQTEPLLVCPKLQATISRKVTKPVPYCGSYKQQ